MLVILPLRMFYASTLGEIREAITIDLPGLTDYTHLGLYAQGLNGQQANADIVTVVTRLSQWVGAPIVLQSAPISEAKIPRADRIWEFYKVAARGMVEYSRVQFLGYPISDHALFPVWRSFCSSTLALVLVLFVFLISAAILSRCTLEFSLYSLYMR